MMLSGLTGHLEKFKVALALLAGVGLAIPGMSALSGLELPPEAGRPFPFILTAFSAAAVLIVYVLRNEVTTWSDRQIVSGAIGFLTLLLGCFVGFIWLVNVIWVRYTWRLDTPSREFMPLFLPDTAQRLIKSAGSRSQFLTQHGPDALARFTTETSVAFTLAVLIVVYSLIVVCLAAPFTLLVIRAASQSQTK